MKPRSLRDAVAVGFIRLCARVAVVVFVVYVAQVFGHPLYHPLTPTFQFTVVSP